MKNILLSFTTILIILTTACSNRVENNYESITDAKIRIYEEKISEDPLSYFNYNKLAQNYIQKARETGNEDYYKKAKSALIKSDNIFSNNYETIVLLAQTSVSHHYFEKAAVYSERAIELNPKRAIGYAVLGDAYLELEEIEKAQDAYSKMIEIKPNLNSYSRLSNLEVKKGNMEKAIIAMQKAYESGLNESLPKENLAWTQVMIGLIYLNKVDYDKAEFHYNKAVKIDNNYYLALEHLAEVKALKGNFTEAERIYKKVIEINPAPEFLFALADVYKNLDKFEESKKLIEIANNKKEL